MLLRDFGGSNLRCVHLNLQHLDESRIGQLDDCSCFHVSKRSHVFVPNALDIRNATAVVIYEALFTPRIMQNEIRMKLSEINACDKDIPASINAIELSIWAVLMSALLVKRHFQLNISQSTKVLCSTNPAVTILIVIQQSVKSRGQLMWVKMPIAVLVQLQKKANAIIQ